MVGDFSFGRYLVEEDIWYQVVGKVLQLMRCWDGFGQVGGVGWGGDLNVGGGFGGSLYFWGFVQVFGMVSLVQL